MNSSFDRKMAFAKVLANTYTDFLNKNGETALFLMVSKNMWDLIIECFPHSLGTIEENNGRKNMTMGVHFSVIVVLQPHLPDDQFAWADKNMFDIFEKVDFKDINNGGIFKKTGSTMNKNEKNKLFKAASGNIGAVKVLMDLAKNDLPFTMKVVDMMEMTGTESHELWQLFKDVCGEDIVKTIANLAAWVGHQVGSDVVSTPLRGMYSEIH